MESSSSYFEIVAGTYEQYILGYVYSVKDNSLSQTFASHDHSASIRCLASNDHYLGSGASDDRIIIYDLKSRKEHCMLTHHNSTITALTFTMNHSHIISASQDGALGIVRVGNWQLEKLWEKAHKYGHILDIAVHSSGKLALTLGSDSTIHTWNLVKGREAYIINLKTKCRDPKSLEKILFAPDDSRFLIYGGKFTEIWSIKVGGALQVIEHDNKISCCLWLDDENLFVGYEDGNICKVNLETGTKKIKLGHNARVKTAQFYNSCLVTASSSGEIKVWSKKLKELSKITTGCRITCLQITTWMGKIKTENSDEEDLIEEVPVKKPVKSRVIIEKDDNSDQEEPVVKIKRKCKEKKNKKRMKQ